MNKPTVERNKIIEEVNNLPDEFLSELATFLEYLRYKTHEEQSSKKNSNNFLSSISGLGNSGYQDTSERDEEILKNEVDPTYGWNLKSNKSV